MTREDIDNIISIICPNDEDFEKPIISPAYLKKELETLALEEEPSGDLISRQAVQDAFWKLDIELRPSAIDAILNMVNGMPSVKQDPKEGHWIVHPKGVYAHLVCDKCLSNAPYDCRTNYCPNCGARMVEQEERDKE